MECKDCAIYKTLHNRAKQDREELEMMREVYEKSIRENTKISLLVIGACAAGVLLAIGARDGWGLFALALASGLIVGAIGSLTGKGRK